MKAAEILKTKKKSGEDEQALKKTNSSDKVKKQIFFDKDILLFIASIVITIISLSWLKTPLYQGIYIICVTVLTLLLIKLRKMKKLIALFALVPVILTFFIPRFGSPNDNYNLIKLSRYSDDSTLGPNDVEFLCTMAEKGEDSACIILTEYYLKVISGLEQEFISDTIPYNILEQELNYLKSETFIRFNTGNNDLRSEINMTLDRCKVDYITQTNPGLSDLSADELLDCAVIEFHRGNLFGSFECLLVSSMRGNINATKIIGFIYVHPRNFPVEQDAIVAQNYLLEAYNSSSGSEKEEIHNILLDLYINNYQIPYADLSKLLRDGYDERYEEANRFIEYLCQGNDQVESISLDEFFSMSDEEMVARLCDISSWVLEKTIALPCSASNYQEERSWRIKIGFESSSITTCLYDFYTKHFVGYETENMIFETDPTLAIFFI